MKLILLQLHTVLRKQSGSNGWKSHVLHPILKRCGFFSFPNGVILCHRTTDVTIWQRMISMILITTSIPISFLNGWNIAGGGNGEHTGIGFLSQSSLLSFATESSSSPKWWWNYTTVHQQPTIFQREPTKLWPYESTNAAPAKMFATTCVRRVTSYMRHHSIHAHLELELSNESGQPNQRLSNHASSVEAHNTHNHMDILEWKKYNRNGMNS
jgi:hypothetical protein